MAILWSSVILVLMILEEQNSRQIPREMITILDKLYSYMCTYLQP